ncbi:FAD-binding monooxygenase [Streptomyces sp. NPDC007369]|uniref:FAD-dependent oxidoreductase n=1 Tax=Streptomyces sp. NPDC007369 TaxID=3154589 RepID=UPI0033CA5D55
MAKYAGDHAVVLGGSIAGLLAARVLSDAYARVTIVDRDTLTGAEGPRRGIPQGHQIHGLQPRGQQILEELFPGFTEEMGRGGAQIQDTVNQGHWYFRGKLLRKAPSDLVTVAASRPFLEARIRARVLALPGVSLRERHEITGLTATPDRTRITGVRVTDRTRAAGSGTEAGAGTELPADLVVDATGRGTRTPVWLRSLGYAEVAEERLEIGVGYATRQYRLPPGAEHDGRATIVIASPGNPRGAICAQIEDERIQLTVNGICGDIPPTDAAGFEAYVKSLPVPGLYELTQTAEPLGAPVAHRFPVSLRRRYERMPSFPQGLLVAGDGVCSFNPVYAQGMTAAALGALVLRRHLARGSAPEPLAYLRDLAREAVAPCWDANAVNDLQFPGIAGRRSPRTRLIQRYSLLVQAAAARDAAVSHAFVRVLSLVDPGHALMRPAVLLRVLRHALAGAGR